MNFSAYLKYHPTHEEMEKNIFLQSSFYAAFFFFFHNLRTRLHLTFFGRKESEKWKNKQETKNKTSLIMMNFFLYYSKFFSHRDLTVLDVW